MKEQLSDRAIEARRKYQREYKREWRKRNAEKIAQYEKAFWERKAEEVQNESSKANQS